MEQAGFPQGQFARSCSGGQSRATVVQCGSRGQGSKTHSAYVTGKVILAQLIPVLNVLLWVLEELLNRDGHPADTCVLQQQAVAS